MYNYLLIILLLILPSSVIAETVSPTEGSVNNMFVHEDQMKTDILVMLANFTVYMKNDFMVIEEVNCKRESLGCFKGESSMSSKEGGVRPNADMSMICAFLTKYGKGIVDLPDNISWNEVDSMAIQSLRYAYSTHKANKLLKCSDGKYWGSLSTEDAVWESSLWAMSVAYSAFFQWDRLNSNQKEYIYKLLKAECNYELERTVPTNYESDTKAEENGWEADVLAVTLGLFPNDDLAPLWFKKLREFAINSLSHPDDELDNTIIDPEFDVTTVKDLYCGANLFYDYTLQNHNYFHTGYQNVVIQELGEAALALKLFQRGLYGVEKWKTNALMHNCENVMKKVLYWLALADGELAMPNGNDWSLFLYDQLTSYTTNACFLGDSDALMLENLAYKMIKARQSTTNDGSFLLRPDVGARRMGVEGHRIMMTWLMHEIISTRDMVPSNWDEFNNRHSEAKIFGTQNIVRASTDDRFACFSWCNGIKSYTGYIATNSVDRNKIIVPLKGYNTGNFLGWYEVDGSNINATPIDWRCDLSGKSFVFNGELETNDGLLNHRFSIYSTPGNAVIYMDYVVANKDLTILRENGGLLGISVDDFTSKIRYIHSETGIIGYSMDDKNNVLSNTKWINIDNSIGVITAGEKDMFFGDVRDNNSIETARLIPLYSNQNRNVFNGDMVDKRVVTYYSNINSMTTSQLSYLNSQLLTPEGWNGCVVSDPDSTRYLFVSNFGGQRLCQVENINTTLGAPVFKQKTIITEKGSTVSFQLEKNHSIFDVIMFFLKGKGVVAEQDPNNRSSIYVVNNLDHENEIVINAVVNNEVLNEKRVLLPNQTIFIGINGNQLLINSLESTGWADMKNKEHCLSEEKAYNLNGIKINHQNNPFFILNKRKAMGKYDHK